MATEKDITDQRDSDVELLDNIISEAITIKNGLAIGDPQRLELSTTISNLMDSRTDLHIQELMAGLHSAQLAAALVKITAASDDLKKEAEKMKTVTTFISRTNAVIGAATKVTNIVKNGG
ncbi:hypothetical protein CWO84_10240 [Methylomonas sp. Kb3]|uniref:hypothetical protein n=1 Tax=Methylomonas sp. Kb3 TaxID=1611544 RepID=UPI000C32C7E3|nr:hypothetical protein [Methylomonas sp. Kb3]PKD40369.1 hypothetical protein CWO84_10240 [Methylomonas sp. Kb3]